MDNKLTAAVHIGNNIDASFCLNYSEVVAAIFAAGQQYRMDPATIQVAIAKFSEMTAVTGTSLTNCHIATGNTHNSCDEYEEENNG